MYKHSVTMRKGDVITGRIRYTNGDDAREMFETIIKENVEEGYRVINRQHNRVELVKDKMFSRMFGSTYVVELD